MNKMLFMIEPMVIVAAWLFLMMRFLDRFARVETAAWESLGRPVMRFLGKNIPSDPAADAPHRIAVGTGGLDAQTYYTPEQSKAAFRLFGWILLGKYRDLSDTGCRRLGTILRVLALVFPFAIAGSVAAVIG